MPVVNELACKSCGVVAEPDLGWQVFANGTLHLRAECRACGRYITYLPQREADGSPSEWVKAAPVAPEQPALL